VKTVTANDSAELDNIFDQAKREGLRVIGMKRGQRNAAWFVTVEDGSENGDEPARLGEAQKKPKESVWTARRGAAGAPRVAEPCPPQKSPS
jgi:hypothetical protein